jgi:hypothetical protein
VVIVIAAARAPMYAKPYAWTNRGPICMPFDGELGIDPNIKPAI